MKLTDAEISTLGNKTGNWMHFARAIEAAVIEKQAKVDVCGKNCIKCGERLMSDLTKTCYACDHAETKADVCQHRIADARNPVVQSGYICVDCGALFSAADHAVTKVDVEPCCTNWKAGTNCFADPQPNCPHLKVDVEPVKLSHSEDFCYCDHEISLQIVSGGAAPEGLYGRVTLQVKGEYVDYVPDSTLASLQAENERLRKVIVIKDNAVEDAHKQAELRGKRVALSDKQIVDIGRAQDPVVLCHHEVMSFARAIERAHGIGEAL